MVTSALIYRSGTRDEAPGQGGAAHFLEHMMFKGTDRYKKGEIDLVTSKLGGSNNAFTDCDVTAYHFALASDRWEQALEIEANRMRGCSLDPAEFEAEKSVVLEELAMGEDEPMRVVHHMAESLAYQVHPYHHPVIGWKEDLERLTLETMRSYYHRHYGPNRAFLVAVGDIDIGRTTKRIEELFTSVPLADQRQDVLQEPEQKGERRAIVRFPGNVARVAIAVRTCRMGERDDFVLDVLSNVLAGGKSSRLYKRLVLDERIATGVSVHNETRRDPGLLWITIELVEGKDPEKAERMIREEIARVADSGVSAGEITRTRTLLRSAFLFDEETAMDLANKLGRFESLCPDGWRMLPKVASTFAQIGSAEIKNVVARYLKQDRLVVVWSLPEASPAAAKAKAKSRRKPRGRR